MRKIDFLVIGAQKCATSWLHNCLAEHPNLILPEKKREVAFIGGELFRENGEEWFEARFSKPRHEGVLSGDVSVDYMYHANTAVSLDPYLSSEAKFICVLREPVSRFESALLWFFRRGKLESVQLSPIVDFLESQSYEPSGDSNLSTHSSELWRRGCYAEQLQPYLDRYGPERVKIVLYDEISADSKKAIAGIFSFLGVDSVFEPRSLEIRPKMASKNKCLLALENKLARNTVGAKIFDHLNQFLAKRAKGQKSVGSKEVTSAQARLAKAYRPQNEKLLHLLQQHDNHYSEVIAQITKNWM